jgi:hypothetical protein
VRLGSRFYKEQDPLSQFSDRCTILQLASGNMSDYKIKDMLNEAKDTHDERY